MQTTATIRRMPTNPDATRSKLARSKSRNRRIARAAKRAGR